jgi:membrane associated rhomboid family serine protease
MHLFFNLLMLAFIGSEIEAAWGRARFLRYYFFCATAAGLAYLLIQLFIGSGEGLHVPMVGASGAIYGLLIAYGLLFGERVMLFMMLFPMKAKHFVWVLAGIELLTGIYSSRGGLSSVAHLGGMLAGFIYLWGKASIIVYRRRREEEKRSPGTRKRRSKHLKLMINNDQEFDGPDDHSGDKPKTWH